MVNFKTSPQLRICLSQDLSNEYIFEIIQSTTVFCFSGHEYDRYGFSRKHYIDDVDTDFVEDDPLGNKAAELERQSQELSVKVKVSVGQNLLV